MTTIQMRAGGNVVGTTIRLPRELRDEMKIQAIQAGRSLNTHVVMILREATKCSDDDARC
ncbi:Arc family DNA-binding protein [Paracoccus sediminilitoris]|uniref:Arc family DNA-binding protein n=1 Tax=Paracoccus sediminilitoris TaxID=2202419 RepID=UPI00272B0E71|nr:Arc family DNA-binding protein [Paracoccus sediminilitoris]